jgi:RNA polymerase sigma-70 factor, ECF subfamily
VVDWEQVIRKYSPEIWKTVYRLVGNRDDTTDCVQDTFLSAMRLENSTSVEHWNAYLHRIAVARAMDCLRNRYRISARREPVPPDLDRISDDYPDPQRQAQLSELAQRLLQSLAELPKQQAEAFTLRYVVELEYAEIAESMGINANSVGALLHRAREKLRRMLSHVVAPEKQTEAKP